MNSARVDVSDGEPEGRLPKRKVALLFGYVGHGYNGSQVNPGAKTIEGDIFQALVDAGCVSRDNAVNPTKVQLNRTARTDAGVHAAVNCISLKMIINPASLTKKAQFSTELSLKDETSSKGHVVPQKRRLSEEPTDDALDSTEMPSPSELVDHLNSHLPSAIRIWRYIRVQNSFNPRTFCDSRSYEYNLPTYVLLPPHPSSTLGRRFFAVPRSPDDPPEMAFWDAELGLDEGEANEATIEQDIESGAFQRRVEKMRQWRISLQMLQRFRDSLKIYEGTHKFHNFTVGKAFNDASVQRTMRSVTVTDPIIVNGTEWITIKIHGQSFMLHQIRKMVGLCFLICRTCTPSSLIPIMFEPSRFAVPKAPALGLMLERPHFSGYNKKVSNANATIEKTFKAGKISEEQFKNGSKELLVFDDIEDRLARFKTEEILPRMQKEEDEGYPFAKWSSYLDVYTGDAYLYLNREGEIPDAARMDGKTSIYRTEPGLQNEGNGEIADNEDGEE